MSLLNGPVKLLPGVCRPVAYNEGTSMGTTTDYDAPRTITTDDSLEELQARRAVPHMTAIDIDESDLAATFESLATDQLDEELTAPVVPMQTDEFRCGRCFLVRHRSQRAAAGQALCQDCA